MKKVMVVTGGGDCPGLNAVIRGIVKRSFIEKEWEVVGSIEAFNGVYKNPPEIIPLDGSNTSGIHVKGGTIIKTTNKGDPFKTAVKKSDGTVEYIDRSDELIQRLKDFGIDAVINIGGDGSQRISQKLYEKGLNVVGVPKTIDNDLSATDLTFGFRTAVQISTDAFDKLVTTAESHHRVLIMEVMGRDAGWIALHTAIAGGAEVCLIPEVPYDVHKAVERIRQRYEKGKGFVNIVIAEGAKPVDGDVFSFQEKEQGSEHIKLGGVAFQLSRQLKMAGCEQDIRETVLGHIQRGGTPIAFDRILGTIFGVKAFEMVLAGEFGNMVAYKGNTVCTVPIIDAISSYNFINTDSFIVQAAKSIGISFGD